MFARKIRLPMAISSSPSVPNRNPIIAAFVVAHSGVQIDQAEIENFAAERLAAYKRPRAIVVVDALPRTANGKIMRSALRLPENFGSR